MKYEDHMEKSSSSSHKEDEEEEEHVPYFLEDTKKEKAKNDLTLPCHQWHVMSCHEPSCATSFFVICNSILEICIVKWKSNGHLHNMKRHGKSRSHGKSNSYEGSQWVTRKVKHHLSIGYILILIVWAWEFSPSLHLQGIRGNENFKDSNLS